MDGKRNSKLCAKQPTIEDKLIPLTCCLVSIEYIFSCVSEEQEEQSLGIYTFLQQLQQLFCLMKSLADHPMSRRHANHNCYRDKRGKRMNALPRMVLFSRLISKLSRAFYPLHAGVKAREKVRKLHRGRWFLNFPACINGSTRCLISLLQSLLSSTELFLYCHCLGFTAILNAL